MKPLPFMLLLIFASSAVAAPPPPPPEYIYEAGKILGSHPPRDVAKVAPLFADDVKVYWNGQMIADGKAAWLKRLADELAWYKGRVIAFSEGYDKILVIDTFDTVDRRNLPSDFIADPRPASRSTLYEFGKDRRVHVVRISEVETFLQAGKD